MVSGVGLKRCPRCGQEKDRAYFSKSISKYDGLNSYCKPCMLEYQAERHTRVPLDRRRNQIKHKYGITLEQFDAMRASQADCCAICGNAFQKIPNIDHCHATGRVRALLCENCNRALGMLRDSPETCRAAARYLELHRKQQACNENEIR